MTATSTPNATPLFPSELVGKILFLSNRGGVRQPEAYMINPDGTGLAKLTNRQFYDRAKQREAYSPDRRYYAYAERLDVSPRTQIYLHDAVYDTRKQLTFFGAGTAWAPAWSPNGEKVALVSSENRNDEIWIVRPDEWPATQLTANSWEWDHSPSWSPDGEQILFDSNRTGTRQLWLMAPDGKNPVQFTNFPFEAWDPVWVKDLDQ